MITNARRIIAGLASLLALTMPAAAQPVDTDPLAKIGHIVVIFEENRSFDNLFGKFPGANGIANASETAIQIDRAGKPYETLPSAMNTNLKPPEIDKRFPAQLPNRPFEINSFVPLNDDTGDLTNGFYQEQLQINGGAMNRYADVSNAKALTMGYFDISETYLWKLVRESTLGDAMFHSAFGGSFLNHAFLVCSCAFRWPNAPEALVAKLDANGNMVKDGQITPDGYAVSTSRSVYLHAPGDTDQALVPPQTMPHIGDRLDAKNISWKWYSGGYADAMAGHADARFQFHHQPLQYFQNLAAGTIRRTISGRSCARSNYASGSIRWKTQTGTHTRCATSCTKGDSGMAAA
jgi:phospholipase C